MYDREDESSERGVGRPLGRRTVIGASIAGLAGAGLAGTAVSQDDNLPNELVIISQTDRVEYAIEVDGRIEFGDESGDGDEIEDGTTVTGVINGAGQDNYHFSGGIVAFEITEGADATRVFLNGQEVDPDDLASGDVDLEDLPYQLSIRTVSDEVEYELSVDGNLDHAEASADASDQPDIEGGYRVEGSLEDDDEHAFRFWGIKLILEIPEGIAEFTVDLEDDGSTAADRLPHRLLFFGLDDVVQYRFSVSDTLEFGEAAETEDSEDVPADERVDETTVEGYVHAHDGEPLADDYRFSGSLEVERAEGPTRFRLNPNEEEVDEEEEDE